MDTHDNITDIRSGVRAENIQEALDAAVSPEHALQHGQQQYQTPLWLAEACAQLLPGSPPSSLDPQCAGGNLLTASRSTLKLGCDYDNAFAKAETDADKERGYQIGHPIKRITISCVKMASTMKELYADLRFPCIVANPPFGIRWRRPEGGTIESMDWTWQFIQERLAQHGYGYFIASAKTIEALSINVHPWVYLYQKFPAGGIWDNSDVAIGIVHFQNGNPIERLDVTWTEVPSATMITSRCSIHVHRGWGTWQMPGYEYRIGAQWAKLTDVINDEKGDRPKYNIYLKEEGMLGTYLSTRQSFKVIPDEIAKLAMINDCHPLTLTTERETRKLLQQYLANDYYTIQPEAKAAIAAALAEVNSLACPIRPVTDFELVAYADEEDSLLCKDAGSINNFFVTPGKRYELRTGTYTFQEKFTRKKLHYNEETDTSTIEDHDCVLSGEDRYIEITDDRRKMHRFMERPNVAQNWQHPESLLWQIFKEPYVLTIAETFPEKYERNLRAMELNEQVAGFNYFAGQRDYYARMACKDYGLVAAATGTGKTLGALTLVAIKSPRHTLIIAPQGTMRSVGTEEEIDYEASQWVKEIARFAPTEPVFQIFNKEEWRGVLHANGGELPPGIYITYPQAYFSNGAFENIPDTWSDLQTEQKFCERYELKYDEQRARDEMFSRNVGCKNKAGIRCIAEPSLGTLINLRHGEAWDMVILDEAHLCFPYATKVNTREHGPISIGEIVDRKLDVEVSSYDIDRDVVEWKRVTGWFRNLADRPLVRVVHERGAFVCTDDHKIRVGSHWKPAISLMRGEELRVVRGAIQRTEAREENASFLQRELRQHVFGPEEGSDTEISRVVRVEILQRRGGIPDGLGRGADHVYCLEVAGNHNFFADGVLVSNCANLDARVTQNMIRLQPKYRYAMTASPIPNIITNIFSLMGWICVPNWYKGKIRNAAWPYSVDEAGRFTSTFLSCETDLTAQHKARMQGKKGWRNTGVRPSPLISSPARLLKLLKPSMAHISLDDCNPDVVKCEVIDVRVPLGKEQAVLYEYWLNRGNYIPEYKNPLTIAQVQSSRLRGVCASPATLDYTRGKCKSNFNAKTLTILQVIRDCLKRGEQVVVVSARVQQSQALASRLRDAGISLARIDSTVTADLHTAEANRFKRGDARVMLMGIKCAQGHSFDRCRNLIVGSLEWSYGTFLQAKGRIWRLTSPQDVRVWVILHQNTIEELLFDRVAVKQDAATLCLHGKRVPRDFKTLDASEILAEHVVNFDPTKGEVKSESECETQWPELRRQLVMANQPQRKIA